MEFNLATSSPPAHLSGKWEMLSSSTKLCLYLQEGRERTIGKSRKARCFLASQQAFLFTSQWQKDCVHTWGKDGLCRGKLMRELHCWEWNSSLSQMELSLFTSLSCAIHSVHLADAEGKSFQQIPWKHCSARACFSSFRVNQHVI